MKLGFPKISRPKASPSHFQEGGALREGQQEFPGHTKAYSAHKGYLPSQPSKFARITVKEQSWDSLLNTLPGRFTPLYY